jgi:hypothetical protein
MNKNGSKNMILRLSLFCKKCNKKYSTLDNLIEKSENYLLCPKCRHIKLCPICNKEFNARKQKTCSKECAELYKKQSCLEKYGVESINQLKEIKEKKKKTCIEKYGVDNPFKSKEIQNQIKQTNLEKYGVEYGLSSVIIQEKSKQANLQKYGVDNPWKSKEIQEKSKQTNLQKYGVENPSQIKEVKENKKRTNLKKYGVEYPSQNKEIREKTKQTWIENYGVDNPFKSKEIQNQIKQTNLERYGVDHNFKSKEIQNQIKQTNLERYGVEYALQNKELFDKQQKSSFILKDYQLPSEKIVKIQGYEWLALDELFQQGYQESDIVIKNKDIENEIGYLWYFKLDGSKHRYFPDIYIKSENKIIEVKSDYTIKNINNTLKKNSCLQSGLNFEYWIYDKKHNRINYESN